MGYSIDRGIAFAGSKNMWRKSEKKIVTEEVHVYRTLSARKTKNDCENDNVIIENKRS